MFLKGCLVIGGILMSEVNNDYVRLSQAEIDRLIEKINEEKKEKKKEKAI